MAFKNIRIKKRGGGTRLQRVQVLASGKYKFVKNKGSTKSRKSSKSKSKPKKRRNYSLARRRRGRKRSYSKPKIPLAIVGGVIVAATSVFPDISSGNVNGVAKKLIGFNPSDGKSIFTSAGVRREFMSGTGALALGALVHKGAAYLGLNRYFRGLPFNI